MSSPRIVDIDATGVLMFPVPLDHGPTQRLRLVVKMGGSSTAKAIGKITAGANPTD